MSVNFPVEVPDVRRFRCLIDGKVAAESDRTDAAPWWALLSEDWSRGVIATGGGGVLPRHPGVTPPGGIHASRDGVASWEIWRNLKSFLIHACPVGGRSGSFVGD